MALGRKLQLIAERNEHLGYHCQRQRPVLACWQIRNGDAEVTPATPTPPVPGTATSSGY